MMKLDEISQKQADFSVFALHPWGTRAPFAPNGYAGAYDTFLPPNPSIYSILYP